MAQMALSVTPQEGPHYNPLTSGRIWFGSDSSNSVYYVTKIAFTIPEEHYGTFVNISVVGENVYSSNALSANNQYNFAISESNITSYNNLPEADAIGKNPTSISKGSTGTISVKIIKEFQPNTTYYLYIWATNPSVYSALVHNSTTIILNYFSSSVIPPEEVIGEWNYTDSWDWDYNREISNNFIDLLTYKNTSEIGQIIKSCFIYLGSGNGHFTYGGSPATGTGAPFTVYAFVNDNQSDVKIITKKTAPYSSEKPYAPIENMEKTIFTFNAPIYVAPGEIITINFQFQSTASDTIICASRFDFISPFVSPYGGEVSNTGLIRTYVNSNWTSGIPYVYQNGEWILTMPYIYINGSWKPCI